MNQIILINTKLDIIPNRVDDDQVINLKTRFPIDLLKIR